MSAPTLPGSIPGLLRVCSPVLYRGQPAIVLYGPWGDEPRIEIGGLDTSHPIAVSASDVSLDLSDPTGRVHAAWWAGSRMDEVQVWPQTPGSPEEAILLAQGNGPMTGDQIATLRDLVLRLAEVTP